jgi:REP element-mobilizing transposase RayT
LQPPRASTSDAAKKGAHWDVILASHVIFSAYGFWLPNDPRGSWSKFVAAWELFRFGPATTVTTHRSLAATPHDSHARIAAKKALQHPPVIFTGIEALAISRGFARSVRESSYQINACCILPNHVHAVITRHSRDVRRIVGHLKTGSMLELLAAGFVRLSTPWCRGCWAVYLDSKQDVHRAIRYVENNPIKEGKPKQRWSFVTKFDQ